MHSIRAVHFEVLTFFPLSILYICLDLHLNWIIYVYCIWFEQWSRANSIELGIWLRLLFIFIDLHCLCFVVLFHRMCGFFKMFVILLLLKGEKSRWICGVPNYLDMTISSFSWHNSVLPILFFSFSHIAFNCVHCDHRHIPNQFHKSIIK